MKEILREIKKFKTLIKCNCMLKEENVIDKRKYYKTLENIMIRLFNVCQKYDIDRLIEDFEKGGYIKYKGANK